MARGSNIFGGQEVYGNKLELKSRTRAYRQGMILGRKAQAAVNRRELRARKFAPLDVMIDEARLRNAKAIAKVHVDAWRHAYRSVMPDRVLRALTYSRFEYKWEDLLIQKHKGIQTYLSINQADGVVGFVRAGPNPDPEAPAPYEVYSINVLPRLQKKSIGTDLLMHGLQAIYDMGGDQAFLWVLEENRFARHFFKHFGAKPAGYGLDRIGPVRLSKIAYRWEDLGELFGPRPSTEAEKLTDDMDEAADNAMLLAKPSS